MAQVKALKSFEFNGEIKHPWSDPFEIDDCDVEQFKAMELVEYAVAKAEESAPVEPHQEAQKRGRKSENK